MDDHATQRRLDEDRRVAVARIAALEDRVEDISTTAALDPPDDEHDPEGATVAYERQLASTLLADARRHLAELDAALARLAAGTYGVCEGCRKPIPPARLAARPTARACVRCAGATTR